MQWLNILSLCPAMLPWEKQNQIHNNQLRRAEQESRNLQGRLQDVTGQNKELHSQLQEVKRKLAEIECKVRSLHLQHHHHPTLARFSAQASLFARLLSKHAHRFLEKSHD